MWFWFWFCCCFEKRLNYIESKQALGPGTSCCLKDCFETMELMSKVSCYREIVNYWTKTLLELHSCHD